MNRDFYKPVVSYNLYMPWLKCYLYLEIAMKLVFPTMYMCLGLIFISPGLDLSSFNLTLGEYRPQQDLKSLDLPQK
jgi:hypothetical protein